jgi:ribosomal protein S18 acetylase RimI-like enzyme
MTDVGVRPATVGDVPAIQEVARAAWHATYDDIMDTGAVEEKLDEWYGRESLRDAIRSELSVFLVAGTDPVGFAETAPGDEVWHLTRLYVDPERWGNGIGTRLLDRIESRLDEHGVTRYEVTVLADNEVGVEFYESRGFERFDVHTVDLAGFETTEYWYGKVL